MAHHPQVGGKTITQPRPARARRPAPRRSAPPQRGAAAAARAPTAPDRRSPAAERRHPRPVHAIRALQAAEYRFSARSGINVVGRRVAAAATDSPGRSGSGMYTSTVRSGPQIASADAFAVTGSSWPRRPTPATTTRAGRRDGQSSWPPPAPETDIGVCERAAGAGGADRALDHVLVW